MSRFTSIKSLPGWKNSGGARWAWRFLFLIGVIALTGPFIANEKPYYCRLGGESYFPIFTGINESTLSTKHPSHSPVEWKDTKWESVWYAPVPYSYHTIDLDAGKTISPFSKQSSIRFRHWLGTDPLGRDVLAGMIRGCRVSLLIGVGSMLLALLVGVPLGSLSAYWGNRNWRLSWMQLLLLFVAVMLLLSILWLPQTFLVKLALILLLIVLLSILWRLSGKTGFKKISIPVDSMVMSLVSIIDSFPAMFVILILLFIVPAKGWLVVLLAIALLRWPMMARYMRAEVFKMKELNFVKAAQVMNIPHPQILTDHIIPYAFRPVLITFIFGVSSAILAESSLSFLGIGLPADELNWGRLLSGARSHFDAWWLVLFPGIAIFFTLLSLYVIGNSMSSKIEERG